MKTPLSKEDTKQQQLNESSLVTQQKNAGSSLMPPPFSLSTNSPVQKKGAPSNGKEDAESSESSQEGLSQLKSLDSPADPPAETAGSGNGLPNEIQEKVNHTLGGDFSNVKVTQNSSQAESLGAEATAQGNEVHFAPGKFNPGSQEGQELIGHEFKHIDQQRKGQVKATSQAKGMPVNEDKGLEQEADAFGKKIVQAKVSPGSKAATGNEPLSVANSGIAQMRLPTHASLLAMLTDPDLGLSEAVIRDRVGTALNRMAAEGRLNSTDTVPVILGRIFPGGGVIDEAAFQAVVDVTDRSQVYQNVMDTGNPIHDADKARFRSLVEWAVRVCRVSQSMDTSLERVFGTKTADAKVIYQAAGDFLENMISTDVMLDATVTTDYNADDPEVFSGGWANHARQVMHLNPEIVLGAEPKESLITIIHEACHLADSSVVDLGYYPPGTNPDAFSASTEDHKIANAAHFEEFPRRWLGISEFDSADVFTPGVSTSGGTLSREDKALQWAQNALENNWTSSIDLHEKMRDVRQSIENGGTPNLNQASLLRMSGKFGLTIHEQDPAHIRITDLDLVLSEGVVRSVGMLGSTVSRLTIPVVATDVDIPIIGEQLRQEALIARSVMGDAAADQSLIAYLDSSDSQDDWSDLASLI